MPHTETGGMQHLNGFSSASVGAAPAGVNPLTDLVAAWELATDGNDSGPNGIALGDVPESIGFAGGYCVRTGAGSDLLGDANAPYTQSELIYSLADPFLMMVEISMEGPGFGVAAVSFGEWNVNPGYALSTGGSPQGVSFDMAFDVPLIRASHLLAAPEYVHALGWYDPNTATANIKVNNLASVSVDVSGAGTLTPDTEFYIQVDPKAAPFKGDIRRFRIWKGSNALALVGDATFCAWLYNSGTGRTYAELAAYAP